MNDKLKSYVIKDDMNEGLTYGCLIMNKNIKFDETLFQERLDNIDKENINTDYDEVIKIVLDKYKDEYKDMSYIKNEMSFYI